MNNIVFPEQIKKTLLSIMITILPLGLFLIVEMGYNLQLDILGQMSRISLLINYILYELIVLIVYCLFPHPRISLVLLTISILVFSIVNHFVTELKGMPISFADFRAVTTALSVAGNYKFVPDLQVYKSVLTAAWVILGIILFIRKSVITENNVIRYSICVFSLLSFLFVSHNIDHFIEVPNTEMGMGDLFFAYMKNGYLPITLSDIKASSVQPPDEYSPERVTSILLPYITSGESPRQTEKPIIIGIMNEAFSDLSVLGPIEKQSEILSYVYSLKNDPQTIAWGSCLVSIRGTGTANSEFEFLTGDSLRYLGNTCPYNFYDMRGVPNMASSLKSEGYYTIAMHPESATNWRRNGVYPEFGFDEFLTYEDYVGYDTISNETESILNADDRKKVGGRISDLGDYKKLISVLEKQTGPAFLFNVTMQNHSGYSKLYESILKNPVDSDPLINIDEEAATYETLMKMSDNAIEYLVEYLRNYEKPVILVLFGDHQPDLNDAVEDGLMVRHTAESGLEKQQTKYLTQFFIWSNYDTGYRFESKVVSANYLGILTGKAAGLKMTAFDKYLMDQFTQIPAMNKYAFIDKDMIWHNYDEENEFSKWFIDYEMIQYNNLFDVQNNVKLFHNIE